MANAVTFGGCDYVGFHTAMAMLPALEMSRMLADRRQPLPVLKVLYRNSQQIQSVGRRVESHARGHSRRRACRGRRRRARRFATPAARLDVERGEKLLAGVGGSPLDAFNALQPAMQDDLNVHRFVFAHRTYGLVGLARRRVFVLAAAAMRAAVRRSRAERIKHKHPESPIRALVPKLLDQYKLDGKPLGKRDPGDAAVDDLSLAIYNGPRDKAAEAVAAALADGIDPEVVGEAISLASNLYVLRQGTDKWRTHGDSAGVHSSDATNAWRNMARIAEPRVRHLRTDRRRLPRGRSVVRRSRRRPIRPTSIAPR